MFYSNLLSIRKKLVQIRRKNGGKFKGWWQMIAIIILENKVSINYFCCWITEQIARLGFLSYIEGKPIVNSDALIVATLDIYIEEQHVSYYCHMRSITQHAADVAQRSGHLKNNTKKYKGISTQTVSLQQLQINNK